MIFKNCIGTIQILYFVMSFSFFNRAQYKKVCERRKYFLFNWDQTSFLHMKNFITFLLVPNLCVTCSLVTVLGIFTFLFKFCTDIGKITPSQIL
jgi:hypothetical protein